MGKLIKLSLFALVFQFASMLLVTNASASLLGTTINGCTNTTFGGLATTDTSACTELFPNITVVDPGFELSTPVNNRHVDFTGDTVSVIYETGSLSASPDLFIFTDLSWGGQPGQIIGLQLLTLNTLGITTAFTSNSIGLVVNDPLVAGTVTYSILTSHSAIPVPAAFWLFATALIGLMGFVKRKTAI